MVAGAVAAASLVSFAPPAGATTTLFNLNGGGPGTVMPNSQWQNLAIRDDSLISLSDASTNPDSEAVAGGLNFSQGDAYDGAMEIFINGAPFHVDNMATVTSTIAGDGTGIVSTGPGTFSNLAVSETFRSYPTSAVMRQIVTLTNGTAVPLSVTVGYHTNLGSDGSETDIATSSGDTVVDTTDRWNVSDDNTAGGDPALTFVMAGPGNPPVLPNTYQRVPNDLNASFNVCVSANSSVSLMMLHELSQTATAAAAAAARFSNAAQVTAEFLGDLTAPQQAQIVNWFGTNTGCQAATTVSVTASTPTAAEGGADGAFTFTRTGDTSQSLQVGYQLAGSATSGTDYDPPGPVQFAAGQSSVTVPVNALSDNVADDGETVTAVVVDGAGYATGQPSQATVTIQDGGTACANADPGPYSDRDQIPPPHLTNVDCITGYGIAQGFTDGTYRPLVPVTRPQIASFVSRVLSAAGVALPANPPDAFPGDDAGPPHELAINQLAALNVLDDTTGQTGDEYGVGEDMRRDDMAGILANAYKVISGADLPAGPNAFTDDEGNDNEDAINALFGVGVVEGPGGGAYDPSGTVTRGSMGSFLARYIQVLVNNGFMDPLP